MRPIAIYLSFAIVQLLAVPMEAQQGAQRIGPSLGLLVGINRSTLGGSDAQGGEARTGIVAGVTSALPFTSILSLQPELLFSTKGEQETDAGTTAAIKTQYVGATFDAARCAGGRRCAAVRLCWPCASLSTELWRRGFGRRHYTLHDVQGIRPPVR